MVIIALSLLTAINFSKKEPQEEKSMGEVLREQRAQSLKKQREKHQATPSDEKALRRWGM